MSICINSKNIKNLCLNNNDYNLLRINIKNQFNLNDLPSLNEIIKLLNLNNKNIENEIINIIGNDSLSKYYKIFNDRPIINYGMEVTKIKEVLSKYELIYPDLLAGKNVAFTDMDKITNKKLISSYNYLNFDENPPFSRGNKFYCVPFLNIKLSESSGHFTAIFCSLPKNCILYYDSLTRSIHSTYMTLIKNIANEIKKINKTKKVYFEKNLKQTQNKNAYCGIYMLHFILTCLILEHNKDYDNNFEKYYKKIVSLTENNINEKTIENIITDKIQTSELYY
jgi:hypothetical protein